MGLPGFHYRGDVSAQAVGARQRAQEVQVDGTEDSHRPIRTTAEDKLLGDGQTGGLRRLETHRQTDRHAQKLRDRDMFHEAA